MPDALLDIIGVVPVQLVFAYALTKMLNIRRLSLFWVLELVFVLLISSFRSSMSVEFRLAASVPLALIPIFLSQGSLARRILVVTLAHLVLFFAELPGGALWMSMTGTPVADYEAVRTHLGAFFLTHAAHMALLVPLLAMLCMLLNRFGSAQERGMGEWLPVLFCLGTACSGERDDPFTARLHPGIDDVLRRKRGAGACRFRGRSAAV